MKGYTFYLFLMMLLATASAAFAQQRQEQEEDEYNREFVWGINKNTNGGYIGAINLKFSRRQNSETFRTYGFEAANVKHPKEIKANSFYGGSYIPGKSYYLYSLRFSYGIERLMFRKGPQQGVQISALLSGGPTLGVIAPYFIERGVNNSYTTTEHYDPSNPQHSKDNIFGSGRPLEGIGESSFTAGLHLRTGLSLEFGTFKSSVSGLEIGLMVEAFPKEVVLLPLANNRAIFPSAYVTLFHGSRR